MLYFLYLHNGEIDVKEDLVKGSKVQTGMKLYDKMDSFLTKMIVEIIIQMDLMVIST